VETEPDYEENDFDQIIELQAIVVEVKDPEPVKAEVV
jgi:hypothetical protein